MYTAQAPDNNRQHNWGMILTKRAMLNLIELTLVLEMPSENTNLYQNQNWIR